MTKAILFDFYGVINIDGQPNREIAEFLQANNDKYLFGILSASNTDLHDWLITHGINDYFVLVQTTSKSGISKSSKDFYTKALGLLAIEPENAIFVDDLADNLVVAETIGVKTLLYDARKNFLSQLAPLL